MGKRREERERIVALILERAAECDRGECVYHWDAQNRTPSAEMYRRGMMLRALAREIQGRKEAGGTA